MKKIYFLLMMAFIFSSTTYAQDLWPRTYSGHKDAALDGIEDAERNLYIVGSNGSANTSGSARADVTSAEETGLSERGGAFVTKLKPDGSTLWYKTIMPNNYNFASDSRILYTDEYVYALFKNKIYKLKAFDGSLEAEYDLNNDGDARDDTFILDFGVVEENGNTYLVVLSGEVYGFTRMAFLKVIRDAGNSFAFENLIEINAPTWSLRGKMQVRDNMVYFGSMFGSTTLPYQILYCISQTCNMDDITFPPGERYLMFKYNFTSTTNNVVDLLYVDMLNDGTNDQYPVDNFDIAYDPQPGEELIYMTGRENYNDRIYAAFADNFIYQGYYNVDAGKKDAFTADEGKVYYSILDTSSSPFTNKFYGGEINTIDISFDNNWSEPTACFRPLCTVDSDFENITYPIGYYSKSCRLGNNVLGHYGSNGDKTIMARFEETSTGGTFTRQSNQNIMSTNVVISPNPAKTKVTISLDNDIKGSVKIYNKANQLMYSSDNKIESNGHSTSVSQWKPGNYYVQITTESGEMINKSLMVK